MLSVACGSGEHTRIPPAGDAGTQLVDFESQINICPAFQGSSANPTDIPAGQPAQILVLAVDPDGLDSSLKFQWSAPSGTFSEPTHSVTEYRCDKSGPQLLKVVATDSDGCSSDLSVNVTCLTP